MLKIAIVEDEPAQQRLLSDFISQRFPEPDDTELFCFSSTETFLSNRPEQLDILFLDVVLGDGNGMDIARKLRETDGNTIIIFVSSAFQYAHEGYSVNALDFLVKPLSYPSFCSAVGRALSLLKSRAPGLLKVEYDKTTSYVDIKTIYYVETDRKKIIIHAKSGDYYSHETMKNLENKLSGLGFIRPHQAFLVNAEYLESVRKLDIVVNGQSIPISRYKREEFLQSYIHYMGGIL